MPNKVQKEYRKPSARERIRDQQRHEWLLQRMEDTKHKYGEKATPVLDETKFETEVRRSVGKAARSLDLVVQVLKWVDEPSGLRGETWDVMLKLLSGLGRELQRLEDPAGLHQTCPAHTAETLDQLTSDFARSTIQD